MGWAKPALLAALAAAAVRLCGLCDPTQSVQHNIFIALTQAAMPLAPNRFLHFRQADPEVAVSMTFGLAAQRGVMAEGHPWAAPSVCDFFVGAEVCRGMHSADVDELGVRLPSRDAGRGIPALCQLPRGAAEPPLLIHFFGGGIMMGGVRAEAATARYYAASVRAAVCTVGYRLAPEHAFPAAVNDGIDAAIALIDQSVPELAGKYDASRVGIFGGSAGGYMTAQTALHLAEAGRSVAVQVPIIPMVKPLGGTRSMIRYYDGVWSLELNHWVWSMLLAGDDGSAAGSWRANPLLAPAGVYAKVAPAYVFVASYDALRDEGVLYAEKLRSAGKLLALDELNTTHIGLALYPYAGECYAKTAAIFRQHLRAG